MTWQLRDIPGFGGRADFERLLRHARVAIGIYMPESDALYLVNRDSLAGISAHDWVESLTSRVHATELDRFEPLVGIQDGEERAILELEGAGRRQSFEVVSTRLSDEHLCLSFTPTTEGADRLDAARLDRVVASAGVAASMGHELKYPLNHMTASLDQAWAHLNKVLDVAADGISPKIYLRMIEDSLGMLEESLEASRNIRETAVRLRKFAEYHEPAPMAHVDLADVVRECIRLTSAATDNRATVDVQIRDGLWVWGRRAELSHALSNLIENAAESIAPGNEHAQIIEICGSVEDGEVILTVEDTGEGISASDRNRVFDVFYTTREEGRLGLGLSVSARLVDAHEGRIEIVDSSHDGTTVRIALPHRPEAPPATESARPSILIVDDEPALLDVLERQLEDEWDVTTSDDGPHAVSLIRDNPDTYDIILCDLTMRVMSGFRMYHAVTNTNPELGKRFLFMTGGQMTPETEVFSEAFSDRVVMKPFSKDDLVEAISLMKTQEEERAQRIAR